MTMSTMVGAGSRDLQLDVAIPAFGIAYRLKQDGDAVHLALRIHQVHALVRDAETVARAAQAVLDQRPVQALLLVAKLDHLESRSDFDFISRIFSDHVSHLMYGACEGQTGVRARMARLLHAQLEQRAVVVDDRAGLERILLLALERHPVGGVLGEELEPGLELLRVEEARLVIQKLLGVHAADM